MRNRLKKSTIVAALAIALVGLETAQRLELTQTGKNLYRGAIPNETNLITSQREVIAGDFKVILNGSLSGDNAMLIQRVGDPKLYPISPQRFEALKSAPIAKSFKPGDKPLRNINCDAPSSLELPELPEMPSASSISSAGFSELQQISNRAEDDERIDLVRSTQSLLSNYQRQADKDLRTLTSEFVRLPPLEQQSGLSRSLEQLTRQAKIFEQADRSAMLPGERIRFRNYLENAIDKTQAALKSGAMDSLPSLQPAAVGTQLSGSSPDALTDRMVLLNALPPESRQKAIAQLHLVESPEFRLKNGKRATITVPHNGYWLGGFKTGTDCSGLASQALPAEVRKLRFTTLDFRALYQIARTGRYIPPPKYEEDRLKKLKEISSDFEAIQPHLGEHLKPFDLLVYRIGSEPTGHVFIVEEFNRKTLEAKVLEASQSYGGLRSRQFNLSVDPPDSPLRIVRPGLFALRLKKEAIARKCSLARNPQDVESKRGRKP